MAVTVKAFPVSLHRLIETVPKILEPLAEELVLDGISAYLAAYFIVASPRALTPEGLERLLHEGSKQLSILLGKELEGLPLQEDSGRGN